MMSRLGGNRFSTVLDTVASVAMISAALALIWRVYAGPRTGQTKVPIPSAAVGVRGAPGMGRPDAPVTLIEFSDFQCPFCKQFAATSFGQIKSALVDTGALRIVFRQLPIEGLHPLAPLAAEASLCADNQQKFWPAHDRLYSLVILSERAISAAFAEIPSFDVPAYESCRLKGEARAQVQGDVAEAVRLKVTSTPTFFVGTTQPNGSVRVLQVLSGAQIPEAIAAAVESVRKKG